MDLVAVQLGVTATERKLVRVEMPSMYQMDPDSVCLSNTPADKQVWLVLDKALQLDAVVRQSFLSLNTVAASREPPAGPEVSTHVTAERLYI